MSYHRSDQLSILRDVAVARRDDALSELATAYADMDSLQATLADSAVYIRYLRKRVLELELEQSRTAASLHLNNSTLKAQQQTMQEGAFSLNSVKAAIETAVKEACCCSEDEKKKRIRQLQLRWHPDKVRFEGAILALQGA